METLTIVGLGPGPAEQLTAAATRTLRAAGTIFVRDPSIPALDPFRQNAQVVGLDWAEDPAAEKLLGQVNQPGGVVLALLGSPYGDAPWLSGFLGAARAVGASVRVVAGRGLLDAAIEVLGLGFGRDELQVIDAQRLASAAEAPLEDRFLGVYRPIDPTRPLLVALAATPPAVAERALRSLYPPPHPVRLLRFPLRPERESVEDVHLDQLSAGLAPGDVAWAYCPPLDRLVDVASFDTLISIVGRLRAPGGCPWDREQTFQSIKKHLLEETYEAVDALDRAAYAELAGELGDVLLQVAMYAQLGREAQEFDLDDILRSVNEKLIRRHPHVFGDVEVSSSTDVLRNWERIKRDEQNNVTESTFGGVPSAAPALIRADAIQSRAARYGWLPPEAFPDFAGDSWADLDPARRLQSFGDAFFALVALARRYHVDSEEALRRATTRFAQAFERVLAVAAANGTSFEALPPAERRRLVETELRSG